MRLTGMLTRDGRLLFLSRFVRLFSYGALSVILVLYLTGIGLSDSQTGVLLSLTLAGDTVVSLYLTTRADRLGRRKMLIAGAVLMAAAGAAFAFTRNFLFLVIAGTIGVISPSGNEVGPFLSIEQAALAHVLPAARRTQAFAWYTLTGALATALGSLFAGLLTTTLRRADMSSVGSQRAVVLVYAGLGLLLVLIFGRLSSHVELRQPEAGSTLAAKWLGIGLSRRVVIRLSALFALDAFGGGFVVQSFAAYWFYLRFGVTPGDARGHLLRSELFAGIVRVAGGPVRRALRPDQNDGVHAPAVECAAHPGSADA